MHGNRGCRAASTLQVVSVSSFQGWAVVGHLLTHPELRNLRSHRADGDPSPLPCFEYAAPAYLGHVSEARRRHEGDNPERR